MKLTYMLRRETPWIKEWQTPWGTFIDSKLRWLGIEPSADTFLAAWRAGGAAERFDLETAFEFFPYEFEDDIERIVNAIAAEDEGRGRRMAAKLFRADGKLTPEQQRFLDGLGEHLHEISAPLRMVGDNRWFTAYANDAGFHVDTKIQTPLDMPTDEELEGQMDASLSLAYRRILQTVKGNKWLLEPRQGERPIPSLE
ncbi:MAG TPA: hypothetical protein VGN88_09290 [Phycisphaerae bacterium]|jgi:hypothetical protein